MKRLIRIAVLGAACAAGAIPAMAANVGVSINIGQPGYYGRIDIGAYPPPVVMYPQPVVIQPQPHYVGEPIYLRVPPGHAHRWSHHCQRYGACGQPVYFVQEEWYREAYAPRYVREHQGHSAGHDRHDGRGHNGRRHDDRWREHR